MALVVTGVVVLVGAVAAALLLLRHRRHTPALAAARRATHALAHDAMRNSRRRRTSTFEPPETFEPNRYWG